ncbi:MAG TPA: hypothetical protein VJB60_04165 [Candidatus Peribacterales bacterium]|nr:hypothetical protein [Candidatus Peribacterales bacterium]
MALEKHITTREFVRNLKKYKDLFRKGKLYVLSLPLDPGRTLKITVEDQSKAKTGKEIAELFRTLPRSIHIERPVGFLDEIVERGEKRKRDHSKEENNAR